MPTQNQEIKTIKTVKPYEFRKPNATDLFPMINLIKKIGLDKFSKVLTN